VWGPISSSVQFLGVFFNTKAQNHTYSNDSWLKDDWYLFYSCTGYNSLLPFPSLLKHPETIVGAIRYSDHHAELMKRCIARTIYYRAGENLKDKVYVGSPLSFMLMPPDVLKRHFPYVKVVVCVRDPAEVMPSFVALISQMLNLSVS